MAVFSDLHPRHIPSLAPSTLPSSSCSGINAWAAVDDGDGHDATSCILSLTSTDNHTDARLPPCLRLSGSTARLALSRRHIHTCFHVSIQANVRVPFTVGLGAPLVAVAWEPD